VFTPINTHACKLLLYIQSILYMFLLHNPRTLTYQCPKLTPLVTVQRVPIVSVSLKRTGFTNLCGYRFRNLASYSKLSLVLLDRRKNFVRIRVHLPIREKNISKVFIPIFLRGVCNSKKKMMPIFLLGAVVVVSYV